MGVLIEEDENQLKILNLIESLIESLQWYKSFIKDFEIPVNITTFTTRNIEILNSVENLTNTIKTFKECAEKNNFSYSSREAQLRAYQSYVFMRHLGVMP